MLDGKTLVAKVSFWITFVILILFVGIGGLTLLIHIGDVLMGWIQSDTGFLARTLDLVGFRSENAPTNRVVRLLLLMSFVGVPSSIVFLISADIIKLPNKKKKIIEEYHV